MGKLHKLSWRNVSVSRTTMFPCECLKKMSELFSHRVHVCRRRRAWSSGSKRYNLTWSVPKSPLSWQQTTRVVSITLLRWKHWESNQKCDECVSIEEFHVLFYCLCLSTKSERAKSQGWNKITPACNGVLCQWVIFADEMKPINLRLYIFRTWTCSIEACKLEPLLQR